MCEWSVAGSVQAFWFRSEIGDYEVEINTQRILHGLIRQGKNEHSIDHVYEESHNKNEYEIREPMAY
jgi:hypothetical protein